MKKNGFTIIEIIAVIILIGLVFTLVIPAVNNARSKANDQAYEKKITMIESAAILYGQDNYTTIINNNTKTTINGITYYISSIKAKNLVPNYYNDENGNEAGMIIDPRTNVFLDEKQIKIYIDPTTKSVTADFQE